MLQLRRDADAIVTTLEKNYEESRELEALEISRILTKQSTLFAIFLLDFVLPQVSKLSKCLQSEKLDLTILSSLMDATLHTLDDVLQSAAKRILKLQEVKDVMETTTAIKSTTHCRHHQLSEASSYASFTSLKDNIQKRFNSQDIASPFSFDPKNIPNSPTYQSTYGVEGIKPSVSTMAEKASKPSFSTMVESFQQSLYMVLSLQCNLSSPLICKQSGKLFEDTQQISRRRIRMSSWKKLPTSSMLETICPSLSTLAKVCQTLPVGAASVESSISQMKTIKTRLRNRLGEVNHSYLMKTAIESPQTLSEEQLNNL